MTNGIDNLQLTRQTKTFPFQTKDEAFSKQPLDQKTLAKQLELDEKARQLFKRFDEAKNKRQSYLSIWQEVSNYVLPYRGGFYDISPNTGAISLYDRHVEIYDDTATNALTKAASALYSYTANPATQWFTFRLTTFPSQKKPPEGMTIATLMQQYDVKNYLDDVSRIVCSHINEHISSPYHGFCQELIAYSISGFLIIEDFSEKILNVQPISTKDLFVLNDIYGGIGEVYRTVTLTNEQAVMLFGQGVGPQILNDAQNNPLKERIFVHAVLPRPYYDPKQKDKLNMPIASYWLDYQSRKLVSESGYEEFPYCIGRINVPAGYVYGFSPAMNIRHTIKSLNKLAKQKLNAGDLALHPAMNVPIDTYINPLSMKPAALNYHEMDAARVAEPMHTIGNFEINIETIRDAREQVRQGMMIDLIEQSDKDNTYQAMQEQLLQLKLMSPWQGNLERDALKPMAIRVFRILQRRGGILPEPPDILKEAFNAGFGLTMDFQSPLAKAQRHFDVSAIERSLAFGAQLAQVGGMEILNVEKAMRLYTYLLGAPTDILYSEKEVRQRQEEAARQQAELQQQQMMLQQAQMLQAGAQSAKDAAQADQASAMAQVQQQGGGDISAMLGGMM